MLRRTRNVRRAFPTTLRDWLNAEMAEGEEAVEGIFGVEVIVGPMAVEAAVGAPEGIDEIETALADRRGDFALEASQRVQRGGGREEVGNGRIRRGEKAALRMDARKQPVADAC